MEIDSTGLMRMFNTSRCNLLRYEREGKFPRHHRMKLISAGTVEKKLWLLSVVDEFVDSILKLHEQGLSFRQISIRVDTTEFFVKRAVNINRNAQFKTIDVFKMVLETSAQLTNNRGI